MKQARRQPRMKQMIGWLPTHEGGQGYTVTWKTRQAVKIWLAGQPHPEGWGRIARVLITELPRKRRCR
jgi:hypothetical protein